MTTTSHPTTDTVCSRIPPLWPLTRFVAVNPFTGYRELPFARASARIAAAFGSGVTQAPEAYRTAFANGAITRADLAAAAGHPDMESRMIAALHTPSHADTPHPASFAEYAQGTALPRGTEAFLIRHIALACAAHFDRERATWASPWKHLPLYAAWRERLTLDRNAEVFGLSGFAKKVAALPDSAEATIALGLSRLKPGAHDTETFLLTEMRALKGWAGYLRHLDHEATLRGEATRHCAELVAIRMACELVLLDIVGTDSPAAAGWFARPAPTVDPEHDELLARWQTAYEYGYIRDLAATLLRDRTPAATQPVAVDAVFCIDVRSERLRRHLEAALPTVRTRGFAGFFGFPVAHTHPERADEPRCPVLLAPGLASHAGDPTRLQARGAEAWTAFQNSAASCFSFIDVGGPLAAFSLLGLSRAPKSAAPAPRWDTSITLDTKITLAEVALRNMGLTGELGRLVLLCGHGAHSTNNPHAASLECGACGGHAGDVNARLAADTLNDPDVRRGLTARGIALADTTRFLAGLHHTQTDEITLYDTGRLPDSHAPDLRTLRAALDRASSATRAERAASLGLATDVDASLLARMKKRGADRSEVRPEWALAGNAALLVAPRARSRGLDLGGRVFLQDYDPTSDADGALLRLILSAPVVVASWINLQYYASTLNPGLWGAGDKTLHQVVAGIGVVEGNGGDLRSGLPLQSVHDGERFVHEPRRLAVYIEAPRATIDRELAACADARQLFTNGWLHLVAIDDGAAYTRTSDGDWRLLSRAA